MAEEKRKGGGGVEMTIEAVPGNLPAVQAFVEEQLETSDCPMKVFMQITMAVEEIFVNVASYAYAPGTGMVTVRVEVGGDEAAITFIDSGMQYNPLAKADPDVTVPVEERSIGGLGIFLTKKVMDDLSYEYVDGCNVFRMAKKL